MTERTCSVDGCTTAHKAKGFCNRHYQAWFRYGDPLVYQPRVNLKCSVVGCEVLAHSKGMCHAHGYRLTRYGDPHAVGPAELLRNTSEDDRFWSRVDKTSTCWVWQGGMSGGYGIFRFRVAGGGTRAHRYSYLTLVGPVPEGLHLDHLCRNRACVNPDHLEAVTPRENILRGYGAAALAMRRKQNQQT